MGEGWQPELAEWPGHFSGVRGQSGECCGGVVETESGFGCLAAWTTNPGAGARQNPCDR